MVKQYPYTLYAYVSEDSYQDEKGNWVIATPKRIEVGKCRDEVNGSGALVVSEDGQTHKYSWIIYMPKHTPCIEANTKIEVESTCGSLRVKGKVLRYSKDQLHVRIWV